MRTFKWLRSELQSNHLGEQGDVVSKFEFPEIGVKGNSFVYFEIFDDGKTCAISKTEGLIFVSFENLDSPFLNLCIHTHHNQLAL